MRKKEGERGISTWLGTVDTVIFSSDYLGPNTISLFDYTAGTILHHTAAQSYLLTFPKRKCSEKIRTGKQRDCIEIG